MSRAVIDQPGLRVLTVGLVVSLVLGFGLRAQISSARVEKSLEKSVQILEKDFLIDFELAEVRLSKWGLPLPHLIINNLRISPKKNVCQNSQIFIDELELPLQLKNIFWQEKTIDLIRAKNVEVRLVDLDDCLSQKNKLTKESEVQKAEAGLKNIQNNIFSQKTGTRLKEIAIDQLKLISQKNFEQPIVLKQLRFYLSYEGTKLTQVDVKSRLYSIKDNRTDIYFLVSDLNAHIKPDLQQNIEMQLQVKGRLLDGYIQIFMKGSSVSQKLEFEITTKNVSLKAYAPLLFPHKKEIVLDKWPLSLSFYMLGEAQQGAETKSFFKFKNFQALGDDMSLQIPEVDIEINNQKPKFKPFQVSISQIPLSPLKSILAEKFDFQSVENLGVLNGLLKFEDLQRWNFQGDIQKTELIFSNRGSREIETIDAVKVGLASQPNLYNLNLTHFVIQQTEVLGGLEGEFISNPESLQLALNLEGHVLNEKIWKQLTFVSQNPIVKLNWNYKKTGEERHQIKFNSSELEFQGLHLNDVQVDFIQLGDSETRSLALSLKSAKTQIKAMQLKPNFVRAFFNEQTELNPNQDYLSLKDQLSLQGTDWKNMNFDLDLNLNQFETEKQIEHLKAKGEWKSDKIFSGTALLQNANRAVKYEIVKNVKDEIDFIPERKREEK